MFHNLFKLIFLFSSIGNQFDQLDVSNGGGLVKTGLSFLSNALQIALRIDQGLGHNHLTMAAGQIERSQLGCITGLTES